MKKADTNTMKKINTACLFHQSRISLANEKKATDTLKDQDNGRDNCKHNNKHKHKNKHKLNGKYKHVKCRFHKSRITLANAEKATNINHQHQQRPVLKIGKTVLFNDHCSF